MKSKIKLIVAYLLGAITFGSIGVFATTQYLASSIVYKNTTVDLALNDLYNKADKVFSESDVTFSDS